MTARLPTPGSDDGTWGDVLNTYLSVAHNADGTLKSDIFFQPKNYGTITDGGSFGDGLAHPASANGYASLGALQAVYSFATDVSNDMAGLMIQAAINAAHAQGYGTVYIKAGQYRNLPMGLNVPEATNIRIMGDGGGTIILCLNCGTNPGITIQAQALSIVNGGHPVLSYITFLGLNARIFDPATNGGTANTSMYVPGSKGILCIACAYQVFQGVRFINFDLPLNWDNSVGTNYIICFRDCEFSNNNKGVSFAQYYPNSFERITFDNCLIGNNNYGFYIVTSTNTTLGAGSGTAEDFYFFNCSIDYNVVGNYYDGKAYSADSISSVYLIGCHLETSVACSGTTPRIRHDGNLSVHACECFENGSDPLGMIEPLSQYATTNIVGSKGPSLNLNSTVPWVYSATIGTLFNVGGYGNSCRIAFLGLLATTTNGSISSNANLDPTAFQISGDITLDFRYQNAKNIHVTATCNITIPPASTSDYVIGTVMEFSNTPGATVTFVAGGGVTITSSGNGLTFGGSGAKNVKLIKVTTNTWLATGEMT